MSLLSKYRAAKEGALKILQDKDGDGIPDIVEDAVDVAKDMAVDIVKDKAEEILPPGMALAALEQAKDIMPEGFAKAAKEKTESALGVTLHPETEPISWPEEPVLRYESDVSVDLHPEIDGVGNMDDGPGNGMPSHDDIMTEFLGETFEEDDGSSGIMDISFGGEIVDDNNVAQYLQGIEDTIGLEPAIFSVDSLPEAEIATDSSSTQYPRDDYEGFILKPQSPGSYPGGDTLKHPIDDKIKVSLPLTKKSEDKSMNLILSPKDNSNKMILENVETFALEGNTLLVVFTDGTFRNYPLSHLWWYGGQINSGGPRTKPL